MTDLARCPTCGTPAVEARMAIAAGHCPICGKGPYRVVLSHVTRRHGIGRRQARQRFGLAHDEKACDPAHTELCRDRAAARGFGYVIGSGRNH